MKKLLTTLAIAASAATLAQTAHAGEFDTTVPMAEKGAATYYVPGKIDGVGKVDMMVDTGSGYLTINEEALATLTKQKRARYVRDLRGILANGTQLVVPVYSISAINIGGSCVLRDVEAAVFPGKTRYILGLSALEKAAPFIFSTNPAKLVLSNCGGKGEKVASSDAPSQM
jgi:predicted aspartyl protease